MQKVYRLTRRSSFSYVYKKGIPASDGLMTLLYTKSRFGLKFGFCVSKKVGNAVVRNKVKRRLKEIFRGFIPEISQSVNIVIVTRPRAATASYDELGQSAMRVLQKAKLL